MAEIIKYYSNYLNNLNKKYDEYTTNYIRDFVEFKIPVFSCSLKRNDLNITKELKGMFIEQSKYVDSIQKKVDELNDENKELLSAASTIEDTTSTSKPFFHNERLLYYRSLIYGISVVIGIIFLLYMLQATPFIEVASSVAANTKNLAENAAKGAKGLVDNANTQNPDGIESNNMVRNIIIFVLISAVIVSVFYFVIYVLRKVNPPVEKTNTEKEIKRIADSCLRDKSDSWVNTQLEKVKKFLTNK